MQRPMRTPLPAVADGRVNSRSQIRCQIPAGQGDNKEVVVNAGGQLSSPLLLE
jgi:hypothetical protein